MLTPAEFRKQIAASARTTSDALAEDGESVCALFFAAFIVDLGSQQSDLQRAAQRFSAWRAREGEAVARARLVQEGCLTFLLNTWNGLGESHYEGPELLVFAEWLIALTSEAGELAKLPYAFGNWEPTWRQVGRRATQACERLAAAALERDPDCESALYLYAQDDFIARVNSSRPATSKLAGPPVSSPLHAQVAKVETILAMHEEGVVHPLRVPSLETIPVASREIVDALVRGLAKAPHAKHWIIGALGRTRVEHERVVAALVHELETDARTVDDVSMALHYGLKERGVSALEPLMKAATRLVAELTPDEADYRHQWALRTIVTLRKHARGQARARATAYLLDLLAASEQMPPWKRARLAELRSAATAAQFE